MTRLPDHFDAFRDENSMLRASKFSGSLTSGLASVSDNGSPQFWKCFGIPAHRQSGIPKHFQNWGDPLSETLAKPEVKLPENFDQLSQEVV
jgi:hypothetical protein